jgi:aspartate ammonia-lyase
MMAYASIEATVVATEAVKTLRIRCIQGLQANTPRLRKYFESTPQIATALSPKLGYEKVAKLVQEAQQKDMSVLELVRQNKLLSEKELNSLLNLKRLTGV